MVLILLPSVLPQSSSSAGIYGALAMPGAVLGNKVGCSLGGLREWSALSR